jgi:hypothetical protein
LYTIGNKDLATVVDMQDEEIQRLDVMAIESLDHAFEGLSHLLALARRQSKERQTNLLVSATAAMLLLFAVHWVVTKYIFNAHSPNQH